MKTINTLSIDIGGTFLKASVFNVNGKMITDVVRQPTPQACSPHNLIRSLSQISSQLPYYHQVAVGFPGVIKDQAVITAPHFKYRAWKGFKLAQVLEAEWKKPVRLVNDADMLGFAAIMGKGVELVITLGTGFGSTIFRDAKLAAHLELAHHPVSPSGKTYNEYLGDRELRKIGKEKWNKRIKRILKILRVLVSYDFLYIGGGNAKHIEVKLRKNEKFVSNKVALLGGYYLWKYHLDNKAR